MTETRYHTRRKSPDLGGSPRYDYGANAKCPEPALTDPGLPRFDWTERGEAIMADLNLTATTPLAGGL